MAVSPIGVVSKHHSDKLLLIFNMRYANNHLGKRAFKLEGLSYIADMTDNRECSMSYDLTLGYYHVAPTQILGALLGSNK
jgi:hypothetical protein